MVEYLQRVSSRLLKVVKDLISLLMDMGMDLEQGLEGATGWIPKCRLRELFIRLYILIRKDT